IYREKDATEQALVLADANARLAQHNEAEAKANAEEAKTNATTAEANAAAAQKNAAQAEKNALAAYNRQAAAVQPLVALASPTQKRLRAKSANAQLDTELRPMRDDLLKLTRQHLLALAKEMTETGLTSFSDAFVHQQMGDLFRDLGMTKEALKQYEQALEHATTGARNWPQDDKGRANWALLLARLADVEIELRADVPLAQT